MSKSFSPILARACVAVFFLLAAAAPAPAQSAGSAEKAPDANAPSTKLTPPAANDEKAEEVIRRAVEALGGRAYADVRSIVSRGLFTPFSEGRQGLPITFLDYIVFPDRERTEFRGQGTRGIQTHTGETGWVFDGQTKRIVDLKPEQVEDFRLSMRASLDNVLRGWWRSEGASLTYAGRREAGLGKRNETVRLTYPDGFAVEFEFGARDFLPAKVRYKKQNKEGDLVEEEDRYAQFLSVGGVLVPFIIDHFRAGQQSSRVNFQEVEFNKPVPDSLFNKPADIKALK